MMGVGLSRTSAGPQDPALPTLADALDPAIAERAILDRLPSWSPATRLCSVRVIAHKVGRRCVIEYEFDVRSDRGRERVALLGKIRANRFGHSGYRQLLALWEAGFQGDSADGISVPQPVGTVPALQMWLQRKVVGVVATDLLEAEHAMPMAGRIAAAVQKLHLAPLQADRRHCMADELGILTDCLDRTAARHPDLAPRLRQLIRTSTEVGRALPEPQYCSSHRDFYSDQVLVSPDRLYLVDFDLFCEADPGLDLGNFLGHVTERALRLHGDADAFARVERQLEDRFVALAGEEVRRRVRVYAALTLARHVYLSTRFADRAHLIEALLSAADARLRALADGGRS